MQELIIGYISGTIILISGLIYIYKVYKRVVNPNLVTWIMFAIIGAVLILTYSSSGAKENLIPLIVMGITPSITVIVILFRKQRIEFTVIDILCGSLGLVAIIAWYFTKESKYMSQWALYLALAADIIAIIPTVKNARENPIEDRPVTWMMFSVGYIVAFFTITEHTFANYLPIVWLAFGGTFVWWPLLKFRISNKVPLRRWI